jgi:two-component system, NarL family, response regulator DegU
LSIKSVLIVDSNKAFLESAIKFLTTEKQLAVVGWAFDASEALDKINKYNPDLILLDFSLPDYNGLELTRKIKQMPGSPSVIILSINDHEEYFIEALNAGADGFLCKRDFGNQIISLLESLSNSGDGAAYQFKKDPYS